MNIATKIGMGAAGLGAAGATGYGALKLRDAIPRAQTARESTNIASLVGVSASFGLCAGTGAFGLLAVGGSSRALIGGAAMAGLAVGLLGSAAIIGSRSDI